MKMLRTTLILALTLVATTAFAQDDDDMDFGDGAPPAGSEENPNAPDALTTETSTMEEDGAATETAADDGEEEEQGEYPQKFIDRPIILHKGMAEVRLDLPMTIEEPLTGVAFAFRGRFAVTRDIEVGLRWSAAALHEQVDAIGIDNSKTSGKAVQADFVYQVVPWFGAQVSLPFYLDPFAMGLTLGAPVQFSVGPIQLRAGYDLLQVKLAKFTPAWDNPVLNEIRVFQDELNQVQSDGRVNVLFAIVYQHDDALSFMADSGVVFEDFKNSDNVVPFLLTGQWSPSKRFDLGLQTGFGSLDQPTDSFGFRLFAGVRL